MPSPGVVVGSSAVVSTLGELILSIRDLIPDQVSSPTDDGTFSYSTLVRWINDAMDEMCAVGNVVRDWHALASEQGMDVYEMPSEIMQVYQLWYDNWPCWQAPELDALFVTKIESRSYFFGPHSTHAIPRLHVWPAADRTASSTPLAGPLGPTDKVIPITNGTGFRPYGFVQIDDERILYRTNTANLLVNVLRGQAGTKPASHILGATVQELNIMFNCSRLAMHVSAIDDPIEVPKPLWPVLELAVLANVRNAEQEYQEARNLRKEFHDTVVEIAQKSQNKLRHGIQVRTAPPGPLYYFGRVYVP